MTKRVVLYARVSTVDQTKGSSLDTQIRGAREYAARHGLEVVHIIQEDVSGATALDERPKGRQLLELAAARQIDAVVVWRLDRLARPPENEYSRLLTTIEQFARHGVTVYDCETGEIRGDLTSVMIAFFKGLAASQERTAIRERSLRGIAAKAASGQYVGQGDPPYGYSKTGTKRESGLAIHPDRAEVVRRIFYLYTDNNGNPMTYKQIAVLLTHEGLETPGQLKTGGRTGKGGWYPTTIRKILTNANYIGEFTYGGQTYDKPELRLIDDATWQMVQARREVNRAQAQRNQKREYLLSSRIRCKCGHAMVGESKKRRKGGYNVYYRCKISRYDHIVSCDMTYKRADLIEEWAWEWFKAYLSNPDNLKHGLRKMGERARERTVGTRERLAVVEELIKQAELDIKGLVVTFGQMQDATVMEALKESVNQKVSVKNSLQNERAGLVAALAQADFTPEMERQILAAVEQVKDRLPQATFENKRRLFDMFDVQVNFEEDGEGELMVRVSCSLSADADWVQWSWVRIPPPRLESHIIAIWLFFL